MGNQHSSIQDDPQSSDPARPSYRERLRRKIRREKTVQADATREEHKDKVPVKGLVASIQAAQLEASLTVIPPNQDSLKQDETPVKALPTTNTIPLASTSTSTPTVYKCVFRSSLPQPASPLNTETSPCKLTSHLPSAVENTMDETDSEDNMKQLSMTLSKLEYNLQHWEEYAASSSEPHTKDPRPSAKVHLDSRILDPSEVPDTMQLQQYYQKDSDLTSNDPFTPEREQKSEHVSPRATVPQQLKPPKPLIPKVPAVNENTKVEQTSNTEVGRTLNTDDKEKESLKRPPTSIPTTTPATPEPDNRTGEVVPKDSSCVRPALRTQQEQSDRCNSASELVARLPKRFSSSVISTQREQVKAEAAAAKATNLAVTAKMVDAAEAAMIAEVAEARREQEKYDYGMSILLQEEEERARAAASQPPFKECTVCCGSLHPLLFPASPPSSQCTHKPWTCETCLQRWIASQMETKGWKKICCPQCTRQLSHSDVRRASDQKTFERYDRFSMMEAVRAMSNFSWCLRPGCNSGQENRLGVDYMICAGCKYQQCLRHRMAWHKGMTCSQYDERIQAKTIKLVRENENLASERFIEHNTKACPKCEAAIEKSYGCDHMTCSKCRQEFCYLCLVKYEDIRRGGSLAHERQCKYRGQNNYHH